MKLITSRDNPFFRELKKLSGSARQRRKSGQTLLDGMHLLQAFLDSGNTPLHLLVTHDAMQVPELSSYLKTFSGIPLTELDKGLFAELTELKSPTGILALIEQSLPRHTIEQSKFALLLEDIQDPGNLGSMIRTAAAAGCDAVFLSRGCADAWSPRVLRGGMGGHFVLDVHVSVDLLDVAGKFSGKVYAAVLRAEQDLYDCDLSGRVAFAIGNEGAGLSEALLNTAQAFTIPMPGKVESLNAAAAASVCLFEVIRQRQ